MIEAEAQLAGGASVRKLRAVMAADQGPSARAELVSLILLGVATVASAWCAYQTQLWNGVQIRNLARSNVSQSESMRKANTATRKTLIDVGIFLNLVQAKARGDEQALAFLKERVRSEFRPALDAWVARSVDGKPPPGTPFESPQYRVADEEEAARLRDDAANALEVSNHANDNSDLFVLHTVLLALALFFLGLTGQLSRRGARYGALTFGSLVLIATLISVSRLPFAHP
jgi:hypothetical protein